MAAGTAGDVPDRADVVVVGSGSAGLTAALRAASLGASVLVLERATTLGGTTAISGGVIWAPCHFAMHWLDAGDTPRPLARTSSAREARSTRRSSTRSSRTSLSWRASSKSTR